MQGMYWGLLYILQVIKARTFEELATRSHDMEISIANHGGKDLPILEQMKDNKEVKKGGKPYKGTTKKAMAVIITPLQISTNVKKKKEMKETRPSLKELQEKKYPFPDFDVPQMLEDLLEKKVIQLPE